MGEVPALVQQQPRSKEDASNSESDTVSVSEDDSQDVRDNKWHKSVKTAQQTEDWSQLRSRFLKKQYEVRRSKAKLRVNEKTAEHDEPIKDNAPITKVGAVELFCGCAELSLQMSLLGLDAVGVDYEHNKDKPREKGISIDMAKPSGIPILLRILEQRNVKYVPMAPPCGTASRARERRLSNQNNTPDRHIQ